MEMTAERNIEAQLRSAAKIEPDRLPRLKLLAAEWASASAAALNGLYATPVEIEFVSVSSFAFTAGNAHVSAAVSAVVITSPKWRELGYVLADPQLADAIVEAMFGGTGTSPPTAPRPMTKLDRRFVEMALTTMVGAGNPVFAAIAPLAMTDDRILREAVALQLDEALAVDNRAFVELTFRLRVGLRESDIRVALPERAIALHRRPLSIMPETAPLLADETWARDITEGLQLADLQVRALLDEKQITLGDVARFTLGQTITLDATTDSLIIIECEEQRLFRGRMGRSRDSYVVRIEEKIDPTEEFIDDILAD